MRLRQYFARIQSSLGSRKGVETELFRVRETLPDREGIIEGRLRFWDHSLLEFTEALAERGVTLTKTDYTYHFIIWVYSK